MTAEILVANEAFIQLNNWMWIETAYGELLRGCVYDFHPIQQLDVD